MSIVNVTHNYAQSPAEVFAALNDFAGVYRYHPALKSSPLVDGTPATGAGSERVCHMHDGNTLHERIVEAEPNEWLKVEILDTSMPMSRGDGHFRLTPKESGGTEVTLTMDFELTMGVFGKVLDKLVMRRKFTGALKLMLAALEEHLTTGEDIPKGWKPAA